MIPVWRLKGNFGELFSPTRLVPGIKVRSSGLEASTFTHGAIFTRLPVFQYCLPPAKEGIATHIEP